jgi:hypothetical protein
LIAIAVLFAALVAGLSLGPVSCGGKEASLPTKGTALSLRVLQDELKRCQSKDDCKEALLSLSGITWIEGYVVDKDQNDVILYGRKDAKWPGQSTADLVVALRNAWYKYAEQKGNTVYYAAPGCSIDPDPTATGRLQSLTGEDKFARWKEICESPQAVRVLGIPFDTAFAKVMVDADYVMKRVVNGSAGVDIEGFESLTKMRQRETEANVCSKSRDRGSRFSMNRFWFTPEETALHVDRGNRTTFIDKCTVGLKTEQEHLSEQGIKGTGRADPLADRFAKEFTAHYRAIAEKDPIYKRLEQLYRMVAVAKLLQKEEDLPSLDYLIDEFQVKTDPVPKTLGGISQIVEKTYKCEEEGETGFTVQTSMPSCGGVEVSIDADKAKPRDMGVLQKLVLKARPALNALLWTFGIPSA